MECKRINFSGHAVQRMFERGIREKDVIEIIKTGEIIASYRDDDPYPSFLMLGFKNDTPVHVVIARDDETVNCYVITVYSPKSEIWQAGYRERRES